MKKLLTLTVILHFGMGLIAQDFLFTQFHLSPLNLNPALTGGADNYRFVSNYRDNFQDKEGFNRAASFSFDRSFQIAPFQKIGAGIRTGFDNGRNIASVDLMLISSVSYETMVFENAVRYHFLSFGIEGGTIRSIYDYGSVKILDNTSIFGFGFSYRIEYSDDAKLLLGGSYRVVPQETIFSGDKHLKTRYILHGEIDITLRENLWLTPRAYLLKEDYKQVFSGQLGLNFKRSNRLFEIGLGAGLEPIDEELFYTFLLSMEMKNLKFSISKDFLRDESPIIVGYSYEGSIIYKFGKNKSEQIPE